MNDSRYRLPAEFDRLQAPSSAYAPRQVVTYLCTREHLVSVPFAADAEVPETWDCRCGKPATRVDPASADPAPPADPARVEAGEPTAPAS
jgi:hypothetical protein